MSNKKSILLLSGGIDSTTLLAKLSKNEFEVVAISFDYGQKHKIELSFAQKNAKKYGIEKHIIINLDKALFQSSALVNQEIAISDNNMPKRQNEDVNSYVPFRNLIFISTALSLAESMSINEIYIAVNADDFNNFWDCRKEFIQLINEIASLNTSIQVKTPFINVSKNDVVKLATKLGVNLNDTISCYQPIGEQECGECLSCNSRQIAFENIK